MIRRTMMALGLGLALLGGTATTIHASGHATRHPAIAQSRAAERRIRRPIRIPPRLAQRTPPATRRATAWIARARPAPKRPPRHWKP